MRWLVLLSTMTSMLIEVFISGRKHVFCTVLSAAITICLLWHECSWRLFHALVFSHLFSFWFLLLIGLLLLIYPFNRLSVCFIPVQVVLKLIPFKLRQLLLINYQDSAAGTCLAMLPTRFIKRLGYFCILCLRSQLWPWTKVKVIVLRNNNN